MQEKSFAFLLYGGIWVGADNWTLSGILADLYLRRHGVSGSGFGRYVEKIGGINLSHGE